MSIDTRHLAKLVAHASTETQALIQTMLEQDEVDQQWAAQIGPALTQQDVARLLEVSVQAVSKSKQLLRITNRDGRVVYPVFQFDGRRVLPGLGLVLAALNGALLPLTTASWLTLPTPALCERSPAEALRDADVPAVVALAHQVARAAA
jgi:hypothetical protein